MIEIIKRRRKEISDFAQDYVESIEDFENFDWSQEVQGRLMKMVKEGKMVRGTLIVETFESFSEQDREVLKAASAIELAHTGLLIDDDIIDEDGQRRGLKSIHRQYEEEGEEKGFEKAYHYGVSNAICLSNISYFLSFKLMSEIDLDKGKKQAMDVFWRNFSTVGLAEMKDIHAGFSTEEMPEDEILRLYRNKTANYTFSLPMKIGATLAGEPEYNEQLKKIGDKIGLIFQLKDDELGLKGDIGKPSGSDIEENKKTLHRLYLLEALPPEEEQELREVLEADITQEDKDIFIEKLEQHGIKKKVDERMEELQKEVEEDLKESDLPEDFKKKLSKLTEFCKNRDH